MHRQTNTDTPAPAVEYRPPLDRVCGYCGTKYVGFSCDRCATSP